MLNDKEAFGKATPVAAPTDSKKRGCAPSFLMRERGEMDKVCGESTPNPKQEYVQPEEEKESGGEG